MKRIHAIEETDEQAGEIASLINYVKTLSPVERDIYKAKTKKALKVSTDAFKEHAQEFFALSDIDYTWPLGDILDRLFDANLGNVTCAQTVSRWFKVHEEARYFTDEIEQHYIYHKSKLIPMVDTSADCAALLLYHGNTSLATAFGHVTLQVMNAMAQAEGRRIKKNAWLETQQGKHTVYLNLKNECQELAKGDVWEYGVPGDTRKRYRNEILSDSLGPDGYYYLQTSLMGRLKVDTVKGEVWDNLWGGDPPTVTCAGDSQLTQG